AWPRRPSSRQTAPPTCPDAPITRARMSECSSIREERGLDYSGSAISAWRRGISRSSGSQTLRGSKDARFWAAQAWSFSTSCRPSATRRRGAFASRRSVASLAALASIHACSRWAISRTTSLTLASSNRLHSAALEKRGQGSTSIAPRRLATESTAWRWWSTRTRASATERIAGPADAAGATPARHARRTPVGPARTRLVYTHAVKRRRMVCRAACLAVLGALGLFARAPAAGYRFLVQGP